MTAANTQPGVIQLAAGTYRLSRPLVVTGSGVVLRGDGVRRAGGRHALRSKCATAGPQPATHSLRIVL